MNTLRQRLLRFLHHYLVALFGSTRIPVASSLARFAALDGEPAAASAPHLPGVGLLVGAAACVVLAIASLPLPETAASALVAALLSTIATVLLTGAVHEEGLTRSVQRMGPQDGLGTRGTLALVLVLGTKVALLAVLASQSAAGVLAALLGGHAVSRCWPLALGYALPFALRNASVVEAPTDRGGLIVGGLWCLPALALMLAAGGAAFVLLALAASGLALFVLVRRYRQRLQAVTAESLGAAQQVCEVAFYLGAAFGLRG
jgi:adenosylcobinamide-GDP ribazoletransferase